MTFGHLGRIDTYGAANKLLLDFDRPDKPNLPRIWNVCRRHALKPRALSCNATAHGWHVIVLLGRRVAPWQALALQAIMGSDWRRESLNLLRLWDGPEPKRQYRWRWNILYTRKVTR